MGVGLEGAKLHVRNDCETIERTRDEYWSGDFGAIFQGGGEGYAEAVSLQCLVVAIERVFSWYMLRT
jgi:hypothetical protein